MHNLVEIASNFGRLQEKCKFRGKKKKKQYPSPSLIINEGIAKSICSLIFRSWKCIMHIDQYEANKSFTKKQIIGCPMMTKHKLSFAFCGCAS
jgi:hypothetical protein